jgi:RES domain-containing protein
MAGGRMRRGNVLIDAIEAVEPVKYQGNVWRIVKEGRNPTRCSRSGGRWDDGTFDVLYTSEAREGAVAEMRFHLMRGQPVMPSQIKYQLCEINVSLDRALRLPDLAALKSVGLDTSRYGQLSYDQKDNEYPRSQDIAEAAFFLDYDGLIIPSARHECLNIIPFCALVPPENMLIVANHGLVNWTDVKA